MSSSVEKRQTDVALLKRLFIEVKPYWPHILAVLIVDLMATPLALLSPLPLKIVVDNVLGSAPAPEWMPAAVTSAAGMLAFAIGLLLLVALVDQLQSLGSSLLRTWTGEKIILDFRARLFNHAQHLSLSYHDRRGTSDSMYRLFWDANAARYVTVDSIPLLITSVVTLVAMIYIVVRIDWQLALVALAISPILFILSGIYRKKLREHSGQTKRLESSALNVVQEVLTSLRVVKAFGQEEREQKRFEARSNEGLSARLKYTLSEGWLSMLLGLTIAVGTAAVLTIGVMQIQSGVITLGDLLLVMGYLSQLYGPLSSLSRQMSSIQSSLASAERYYAVLDTEPDVRERPNARKLSRARGKVAFQHVSFGYDTDGQQVLHDISFEVVAGAKVGIVGRTGAGKSTLVNLLTRFYDPAKGAVLLDDLDLRDYKVRDLRNQFAIVLQEPVLFSTTIAENIAYGRQNAMYEEIVQAARMANAHEFILALEKGYDTQVGERGMRLSGGERQR
ncbi:MAG: ABC transporter ATP-binding protein, partial [Caldilineaceae bacterium]|nr:ABC transporter ATP-binding protein [Caldilineaceae bacterium]